MEATNHRLDCYRSKMNTLHTSSSAERDFTVSGIILLDYNVQDTEHLFQFYTIYAPDLQFAVYVVQSGPVLVHPAVASGHDTLFVPWHHSQPSNQPVKHLKFTITINQEKISYLTY